MQSGSGATSPTDVPGRTHGDRIAVRVSGRAPLAAAAGDTGRAMSEENVKIVRRGFAGFAESGAEGVIPFYTEDAIIYSIPEWPDDPEYHGHDGVRKLTRQWRENFDDFGLDLRELHDGVPFRCMPSFGLSGLTKDLRPPDENADRRRVLGVHRRKDRPTASLLQLGAGPRSRGAAGVDATAAIRPKQQSARRRARCCCHAKGKRVRRAGPLLLFVRCGRLERRVCALAFPCNAGVRRGRSASAE